MSDPTVLSRRSALRAGSVAIAAGLAGCAFGFGGTNETVAVALENDDDAQHRLAVTITFDGSTLVDRTATLDAGSAVETAFENPDSAGEATVDAELADGEATTSDVRVGPGTGIRDVTVRVSDGGTLSVVDGRT